MSNLFTTFKHLFPKALAWLMPWDGFLRKYIDGLSETPADIRDFADNVYLDMFPQTTRELELWEQQFNITAAGTDQQRRDNIAARWVALGGQGLDYLESVIHTAGFTNVFLHPWFNADGSTKNPNFFLQDSRPAFDFFTGKPNLQTGDGISQSSGSHSVTDYPFFTGQVGAQSGDGTTQTASQFLPFIPYFYYTGKPGAQTGDGVTQTAGQLVVNGILLVNKGPNVSYSVPQTLDEYREILYVGGETFPDFADVPIEQKEEFERLLLRYLPYSHWIGLLINYV